MLYTSIYHWLCCPLYLNLTPFYIHKQQITFWQNVFYVLPKVITINKILVYIKLILTLQRYKILFKPKKIYIHLHSNNVHDNHRKINNRVYKKLVEMPKYNLVALLL